MPNVGDVEYKYGRRYMFMNPDPALGPGTWRLSIPEEYPGGGGGGGGGGGTTYDFDGQPPIDVDMSPGVGANPPVVTTSLDFIQLNSRKTP